MHEILHCMAGSRIPMVLAVGNRSVFAPHGMHCDHTDTMSQRDTGWLQLYCSTVQEVLDTIIQAFKIAEHKDVKLPTMVCYDGYFLTHSLERVDVPAQEQVDAFLPPYAPGELDHLEPGGIPLFTSFAYFDNWYMEFKYQQRMAEERAKRVIEDVDKEFADRFGRRYGGLIDVHRVSDADVVLVMMGSMAATAKYAINVMREAGKRVGLIRVKSFRPFPKEALLETLGNSSVKSVVVLDRFFHEALFSEVRSALWSLRNSLLMMGVMCGINGRDVNPYNMIDLAERGFEAIARGSVEEEVAMYMVRKREEAEA